MIFDHIDSTLPYEERMKLLNENVNFVGPLVLVSTFVIKNMNQLDISMKNRDRKSRGSRTKTY